MLTLSIFTYLIDLELETITGEEVMKDLEAAITDLRVTDTDKEVVLDLLEDLEPALILDAVHEL
jgi:hypothetical protein